MKPEVSIIIPVIRPAKAVRCVEAINENAGVNRLRFEIITEEDVERIGAPLMVKKMTDKTRGQMVCFIGDDCIPQPDFLKHALDAMSTLPDGWGLVGFDDNVRIRGTIKAPAHWLADKRLLPLLGGEFFHTGYKHCWCDNELAVRCAELGRYFFCKQSYIYHDHPVIDIDADDADYRRVYSHEWLAHDIQLFRNRRANNWQTPQGG